MSVIKIDPVNPDKAKIAVAAKIIREGGLVIFPTETVYGIAASLVSDRAMARLSKVKARPAGKPFTVHISGRKMIKEMGCAVTDAAEKLMDKFWPGPLTIILDSQKGGKTGFRMPASNIALELIKSCSVPVVAPSANLGGEMPPAAVSEISAGISGNVDMIIDGGRTEVGVESTVVDLTFDPPRILREGAIKAEEISKAIDG